MIVVVAPFRDRRRSEPLPESIPPETDPGERTATCVVCGAWGIVDADDGRVRTAVEDERVACHVCRDAAHALAVTSVETSRL